MANMCTIIVTDITCTTAFLALTCMTLEVVFLICYDDDCLRDSENCNGDSGGNTTERGAMNKSMKLDPAHGR